MALRFDRNKDEIRALLTHWSVGQEIIDADIANLVGVSIVTIRSWRQRLGIPVAPKFFRHFELNYGEGAIEAFREMIAAGKSYAHIGAHFGFSRQRAQQIAREHFGHEKEKAVA